MSSSSAYEDSEANRSFGAKAEDVSLMSVLEYTVETPSEASHDGGGSSRQKQVQPFPASCVADINDDGTLQIAKLQKKLTQSLGPEYVSTRQGMGGQKFTYLEGFKAIDLANEAFGFNGWSSTIVRLDIDYMDEMDGKRFSVGVSSVMRITLRDGTFHEDTGWGDAANMASKGQALEKAKKEAVTDGVKRALRHFGRMVGNCMYDSKHIASLANVKAQVPKFDPSKLKRGPDDRVVTANIAKVNSNTEGQTRREPDASKGTVIAQRSDSTSGMTKSITVQRANMSPTRQSTALGQQSPSEGRQHLQQVQEHADKQREADRAREERLQLAHARKAELARRSMGDVRHADGGKQQKSPSKERTASAQEANLSFGTTVKSKDPVYCSAGYSTYGQSRAQPSSDIDDSFDLNEMTSSQMNKLQACESSLGSRSPADASVGATHVDIKPHRYNAAQPSSTTRRFASVMSPDRPRIVNVKRTSPSTPPEAKHDDNYKRTRQFF